MQINSAKDLDVYKQAFDLAMEIFQLSKRWPVEEKFSLTDQIRRSSRSVCANLRESWAKRRYLAHFVNKLTDCDGENSETATWLDFAFSCGYLSSTEYKKLSQSCKQIGGMIGAVLRNPKPFLLKTEE